MKISLSFELSKLEMEALQEGMLSNVELLREPLETLLGNDVDNILSKVPTLFKETTVSKSKVGNSWFTAFNFIFNQKFKVSYDIEVEENLLHQIVSTSNYVIKDSVPVLNMYFQLLKTINNFKFSQGASNSIKVLTNRLKLK